MYHNERILNFPAIRNPEECSQGLIGILISPDCCSESTKTILYLFSEAPLFKIDNHELIVRIATIIQEIICGLKNAALKDSNEVCAFLWDLMFFLVFYTLRLLPYTGSIGNRCYYHLNIII